MIWGLAKRATFGIGQIYKFLLSLGENGFSNSELSQALSLTQCLSTARS